MDGQGEVDDLLRFRQPSGTGVRSGQATGSRFQDVHSATAENDDVVDGCRVEPHLGVHCGGNHDRCGGRQNRGGQKIVGNAGADARQAVCRCRCNEHEVGFLADEYVLDIFNACEDIRLHGLAGQRLPRGRADKAQGAFGGNNANAVPCLFQNPDNMSRFVRGNAPGDAENDVHSASGSKLKSNSSARASS